MSSRAIHRISWRIIESLESSESTTQHHEESWYDNLHWKCYTPEIHQIQKLKFLGTNSNSTKISVFICTVRCRGIWDTRFSGFGGCMGWLRLVGSIKLQVSFAEYCLFYRAFAKETYNLIDPTDQSQPIAISEETVIESHTRVMRRTA